MNRGWPVGQRLRSVLLVSAVYRSFKFRGTWIQRETAINKTKQGLKIRER